MNFGWNAKVLAFDKSEKLYVLMKEKYGNYHIYRCNRLVLTKDGFYQPKNRHGVIANLDKNNWSYIGGLVSEEGPNFEDFPGYKAPS